MMNENSDYETRLLCYIYSILMEYDDIFYDLLMDLASLNALLPIAPLPCCKLIVLDCLLPTVKAGKSLSDADPSRMKAKKYLGSFIFFHSVFFAE